MTTYKDMFETAFPHFQSKQIGGNHYKELSHSTL
jgi:hypothetical protein